MADIVCVS